MGLRDVEDPTLSKQLAVRLSPYAPAALYSQETFFPVSDTHFCYRLSKHQGLVRYTTNNFS
jgi:hypothetical protein